MFTWNVAVKACCVALLGLSISPAPAANTSTLGLIAIDSLNSAQRAPSVSYDLTPTGAIRPLLSNSVLPVDAGLNFLDPPRSLLGLSAATAPVFLFGPSLSTAEKVSALLPAVEPETIRSAGLDMAPFESEFPAPSAGETLANEISAALDHLDELSQRRSPLGAGDWRAARTAIAAVYAERNFTPLWLDGDHFGAAAKSALARLAKAYQDGLDLVATPTPSVDWSDASAGAQANADLELSAAVVTYALQAAGARIRPRALSKDVSAKPDLMDAGAALKAVAAADDPDLALAAFNPPQKGYRSLRAILAELRASTQGTVLHFSPGPALKLGMADPRVPLIRNRFGLGSLNDTEQVYDIRVASAVAAFQRVHGLSPNGAFTEATAAALEGGGDRDIRREQLVLANMEMWRWEPRDFGADRVEVNVPDFSLTLTKKDVIVFKTRVIVGKPDTPTPIFSNTIKYMLFNPAWRVPESIVKKEMAPKYAADPTYFERHGYKVNYVGDRLDVLQPPGEANALGRMLFLFPNEYAVYLHDTPQKSFFASTYRALSHGCVRVEDPSRLAVDVLGGAGRGWTESKVRALVGENERTVGLPVPIPVHLEYFTAFVDETGKFRERADLYGLTSKVETALLNLRRD